MWHRTGPLWKRAFATRMEPGGCQSYAELLAELISGKFKGLRGGRGVRAREWRPERARHEGRLCCALAGLPLFRSVVFQCQRRRHTVLGITIPLALVLAQGDIAY